PAAAALPPPVEPEPAAAPVEDAEPEVVYVTNDFWRLVSQLIGGVWLLTLLAWWWSSRERTEERREPEPPPVYKQQAKLIKAARKAAAANDKAGVRAALIGWARLQWPDNAPRSIGEIAARVDTPLNEQLRTLSATSYGQGEGDWNGDELGKALRSIRILDETDALDFDSPLPPLMPPGT
ncbi:MAG TPA: hypothetical protein PKH39_19875, partial [Woeseiaceae bacterium]|nr:hypothetical protein [Woeseiaceae bacterium]